MPDGNDNRHADDVISAGQAPRLQRPASGLDGVLRGPRGAWPMQVWTLALVLVVTLPLGALLFWNAREAARQHGDFAARTVEQLALQMAGETDAFLEDARTLLHTVANRDDMRDQDRCAPIFARFQAQFPRFHNLLLVDRVGRGRCTSLDVLDAIDSYADRAWFRAVANGVVYAMDGPFTGRASKRWVVVIAAPIRDPEGNWTGALSIGIDLARLPISRVQDDSLPAGTTLRLVNRQGVVIADASDPAAIGTSVGREFAAAVQRSVRGSRMIEDGDDEQLVGLASVRSTDWVALAGYPNRLVVEQARETLWRNVLAGMLALLSVWAIAALFVRWMLGPLHALAKATEAVAGGDSEARVRVDGPREIAAIGEGFNRMQARRAADEAALRDGEARYRALFETSSDAIIGVDACERIAFANPAVERLCGWRPHELLGRDVGVLEPAALRERHARAIAHLTMQGIAPERTRSTETRCLHRDGREIPVEVAFSLMRRGDQPIFVVFVRDVSERHAALAELRESELRFRTLADSSPVLIWTVDADVRHFYFNATWLAFTGQTAEQAKVAGWDGGVHPADLPAVQQTIDRANLAQQGCTLEYRRRRHDGEWRWVLDTSAPRRDHGGRFLGYVGTAVDIHDRVMAEGRIRRLTTLYNALSQANEAIARSGDLAALMQNVCNILAKQTGIAAASLWLLDGSGSRLELIAYSGPYASTHRRAVLALGARVPGQEPPGCWVMRENRRHVSADRHRDATVASIEDERARAALRSSAVLPLRRHERPAGVIAVYAREVDYFDEELTDLLEVLAGDLSYALDAFASRKSREDAEAELKRLNATLEERVAERTRSLEAANREMEAFSYSVSHDLRAPLRAVSGFAELLNEGYVDALDETGRSYLARVKAASIKMARLIDDLLDLSRISRQAIHRSEVDLSALASDLAQELSESEPERVVDVVIQPGLRSVADMGLARIALANLLGNAWKFTAKAARASVCFEAADVDGRPGFVVRDNGAGFDPAYADKLFGPFQRLHSERDFPGTGIGLAIVQRIVHRHGGEIRVRAAPGEGAAFSFTL